ncbi:MAG: hypothetical protein ACKO3Q_13760, partial [Betaproteobacteria bacterium]
MEKKNSANTPAGPAQSFAAVASSRRHFIGLVGGGTVLAAAGPLAGCTADLPEAAVQPWRNPDRETDIRRFMLAHALLAPNPHNRQPWI